MVWFQNLGGLVPGEDGLVPGQDGFMALSFPLLPSSVVRKQLSFMLGRQQMFLELEEECTDADDLTEIMSNVHLNTNFLNLAREVWSPPCNAHLVVTVVQWLEEVAAIHTDDDGVHALEAIGNKV